jgi:hypothetical protein
VTDHLEEAAARAYKLAAELTDPAGPILPGVASHLTYLAGLIRGGAVQRGNDVYAGGWFTWPHRDEEVLEPSETVAAMRLHIDQLGEERDSYRKRWHEAATQRDDLVRAVHEHLDGQCGRNIHDLTDTVGAVEANVLPDRAISGDRLRRELWAVLDRMPASDDDLIASVRNLKESQQ